MKNLYEEMSFWDRLYIPALIKGLFTTIKHIPRSKRSTSYQYPEDQRSVDERNDRYRGIHKLTVDNQGNEKCVACFLCATACPANCIAIEAESAPEGWQTGEGYQREKHPKSFEINMLRCIFCGYCVEACPEDAIQMTGITLPQYFRETQQDEEILGRKRSDFIFNKEKLISNNSISKQGLSIYSE